MVLRLLEIVQIWLHQSFKNLQNTILRSFPELLIGTRWRCAHRLNVVHRVSNSFLRLTLEGFPGQKCLKYKKLYQSGRFYGCSLVFISGRSSPPSITQAHSSISKSCRGMG
jgi:hypothetical protein